MIPSRQASDSLSQKQDVFGLTCAVLLYLTAFCQTSSMNWVRDTITNIKFWEKASIWNALCPDHLKHLETSSVHFADWFCRHSRFVWKRFLFLFKKQISLLRFPFSIQHLFPDKSLQPCCRHQFSGQSICIFWFCYHWFFIAALRCLLATFQEASCVLANSCARQGAKLSRS